MSYTDVIAQNTDESQVTLVIFSGTLIRQKFSVVLSDGKLALTEVIQASKWVFTPQSPSLQEGHSQPRVLIKELHNFPCISYL